MSQCLCVLKICGGFNHDIASASFCETKHVSMRQIRLITLLGLPWCVSFSRRGPSAPVSPVGLDGTLGPRKDVFRQLSEKRSVSISKGASARDQSRCQ